MTQPLIRDEIRVAARRWREVSGASALGVLGLYWGLFSTGILWALGWVLVVLALGLAYAGRQRMRFRAAADGPGVVTLDERRVIYMGPVDGGVADLDVMVQLDLMPGSAWRIINRAGEHLDIPTGATGAEHLFDVFTALPGLNTEYMLGLLAQDRTVPMTVWMAPDHKPFKQLH